MPEASLVVRLRVVYVLIMSLSIIVPEGLEC
jgi:hypothetical protein